MNYLFGKHKVRLFELTLICATVIITAYLLRSTSHFFPKAESLTSVKFQLRPGWNLISLPYSGFTAQSLCKNYLNIVEVDRLSDESWAKYDCNNPQIHDFPITPYDAYFVKTDADEYSANFTGREAKRPTLTKHGWAPWISFSPTAYQTASDFCKTSPDKTVNVTEIRSWAFGAWNVYSCDRPMNNFPISTSTVYYLEVVPASSTTGTYPEQRLVTPE